MFEWDRPRRPSRRTKRTQPPSQARDGLKQRRGWTDAWILLMQENEIWIPDACSAGTRALLVQALSPKCLYSGNCSFFSRIEHLFPPLGCGRQDGDGARRKSAYVMRSVAERAPHKRRSGRSPTRCRVEDAAAACSLRQKKTPSPPHVISGALVTLTLCGSPDKPAGI